MRTFLAAIILTIASATIAFADSAARPALAFVGNDGIAVAMSIETLSALPQVERDVSFKTSKGVSKAHCKGPLLWDVVKASKTLDGLDHNKELAKTLLVSAADGYQIAFSIGEIEPDFGNAPILLVLETDGKPLADGFRIVADGDKRGARAIHDIVKIEVR